MCSLPIAIQSCPILSHRDRDLAKKPTPLIERHFRGSKPLQIFTKLRPIIVYTIVACVFKRKSSAARFALYLTTERKLRARKSTTLERLSRTEPEARLRKRLLLYH